MAALCVSDAACLVHVGRSSRHLARVRRPLSDKPRVWVRLKRVGLAPSLASNTVAQTTPVLIGYLCSFLSAPIVLAGLGLRNFGIWALTGALAQYAVLLDFGVGQTLVRFVALHEIDDDRKAMGEFIGVGFCTVAVVSAAMLGGSLLLGPVLADQFHGITAASMTKLLLCASVIVASSMLSNVLVAYSIGRRRMIWPNVALTFTALLYFAFSVTIILLGGKLVAYAIANAVAGVIGCGITVVVVLCQRPLPPVGWPSKARARELLSFSVKNQALALASLVNYQSDKIVLALFIGPAIAGAYELSNRVALAARSVGVYTVSAMVPTLTALRAGATRDRLVDAYERLTGRSAALAIPVLVFTAAVSPLLLRAWLGRVPVHGVVILVALSIAYIVNTTTGVGYATAYAEGLPGVPARAAIASAIANVALTVSLTPIFGLWGTLTGTVLALTAGAFYQVVLLHRELAIAMSRYWRGVLPAMVLSAGLATPVAVAAVISATAPRWGQAGLCFALGAAFSVAYVWLAARRGMLPDALSRRLPRFSAARH